MVYFNNSFTMKISIEDKVGLFLTIFAVIAVILLISETKDIKETKIRYISLPEEIQQANDKDTLYVQKTQDTIYINFKKY